MFSSRSLYFSAHTNIFAFERNRADETIKTRAREKEIESNLALHDYMVLERNHHGRGEIGSAMRFPQHRHLIVSFIQSFQYKYNNLSQQIPHNIS